MYSFSFCAVHGGVVRDKNVVPPAVSVDTFEQCNSGAIFLTPSSLCTHLSLASGINNYYGVGTGSTPLVPPNYSRVPVSVGNE